jgi:hypothetical protein
MEEFRISNFRFSDCGKSSKKKDDGKDHSTGKPGKRERTTRLWLHPVNLFFVSPFSPSYISSGFSAAFHAKLRRHSFSPGDSKQVPT